MNHTKLSNSSRLLAGLICAAFAPTTILADQVILDDLIVDGSICTGMDCVNGESFGFDTIRLKENNLRIRAVDTSSTSSFPTNDWQITFNDSSNGGANKFSIDDIDGGRTPFTIEAGAPSHSLYVDDSGRLGLGTSTPVVDAHVKSGNTPTMRLEQDGSSGFSSQTWDVAGNETNFFVRDASNGSTLPFRIFPSAPSNALTIEGSTGDIGLGTTSPDADLDIEGAGPTIRLTDIGGTAGNTNWNILVNNGNNNFEINNGNTSFKLGAGANQNLFRVGVVASNRVDIAGDLVVSGDCSEQNGACADYVFEPGYKKLSLQELKLYIASNKHLPNIPSADDMQANGVSVANMSGRLLEKVEELVLYTLEQQKSIEYLQNRIEKLESKETLAALNDH